MSSKKRYIGARWGGSYDLDIHGARCRPGDVCTLIPEEQAQAAPQWVPVYEEEPGGSGDLEKPEAPNEAPRRRSTRKEG